jgi:hypothetical protein
VTTGTPLRVQVLLHLPRALLGVPTPGLRCIAIGFHDEGLAVRLGYDAPVDDAVRALVARAETRLVAALDPKPLVVFTPEHLPIDERRTLRDGEEWFSLRHEPPADG